MKFYLTTTLPYVNAKPHIGFAMEIIRADTFCRYRRLMGDKIIFNTGTDEHGQKIYQKAQEEKIPVEKYCDLHAKNYLALKKSLNLSFTHFIRTTDENHVKAAKHFWQLCQKNGDIYKSRYQIKYCVGCELEKTDSEIVSGKCPIHVNRTLEIYDEENYFFRFSKYQQKLLDLYASNPQFVVPQYRQSEISQFVQNGLKDFSISRLKKKMPWGIPVPNDPKHVMYVWFDALINYISTLGWPDDKKNFHEYWPGVQIAGKDNLRQQSAMWQAMLMSAGIKTTKQIYIEGFINVDGQKMSKSLGNVVDPVSLTEKYSTDALRYYLLREIPSYTDGNFSVNRFLEVYNADLSNNLGNLISRSAKLAENMSFGIRLKFDQLLAKFPKVFTALDNYQFDNALTEVFMYISRINHYIDKNSPWEKKGKELEVILRKTVTDIIETANLLKPFLPDTADKIIKQFENKIFFSQGLFPKIND